MRMEIRRTKRMLQTLLLLPVFFLTSCQIASTSPAYTNTASIETTISPSTTASLSKSSVASTTKNAETSVIESLQDTEASETASAQTESDMTNSTVVITLKTTNIQVSMEKLEDRFFVMDGKIYEYVDSSVMYKTTINAENIEIQNALNEVLTEKIHFIYDLWERAKNARDASLENGSSTNFVINHKMEASSSNGMLILYSRLKYSESAMEYGPTEYFNLFIDEADGHLITFDEFLEMFSLAPNDLAMKAQTVLHEKGPTYEDALITAEDINEDSLVFDGSSLLYLFEDIDIHNMGYFLELNLGKLQ